MAVTAIYFILKAMGLADGNNTSRASRRPSAT